MKKQPFHVQELAALLQLATTAEELELFLSDLLTRGEITDLVERWRIVQGLLAGMPQRQIKDELGVSISLVTRASTSLKSGGEGFRLISKRTSPKKP